MRRRVIWSSFIGATIEWYDFYLYGGASAVIFGKVFFAQLDPTTATIASFGTLAAGFVARPLGGIVFGHFGDRLGRKSVLVATVLLMGIATTLVGLLPTYAQVGVAAPLLLILLRIIQGLSAGGEWAGAVLMTFEYSKKRRRGLTSSITPVGTFTGLVLANGALALVSTLPTASFESWGWRLPFLVSIVLVAVGLWLRRSVSESPQFKQAERQAEKPKFPLVEVFKAHPRVVITAILLVLSPFTASGIFGSFATAYALELDISQGLALTATLIASALAIPLQPVFGALSDRIGRKATVSTGIVLLMVSSFVLFLLTNTGSWQMLALGLCLMVAAHAMAFAPIGAWLSELFPTAVRYSGVSFVFQIAGTLGGGFGPLIAASILAASGGAPHSLWISLFLTGVCVLSLIGALSARDTSRVAAREPEPDPDPVTPNTV